MAVVFHASSGAYSTLSKTFGPLSYCNNSEILTTDLKKNATKGVKIDSVNCEKMKNRIKNKLGDFTNFLPCLNYNSAAFGSDQSSLSITFYDTKYCTPSNVFNEVIDRRLMSCTNFPSPVHLSFGKPPNSELWRMRRLNEPCLAGYNPLRGDFKTEYQDAAEHMLVLASQLADLKPILTDTNENPNVNDDKLLENLQVALVERYNTQVYERHKRKSILKQHGLMNQLATQRWNSKRENALGKLFLKKLTRLTNLVTAEELEHLCGLLESVNNKRTQVNKLIYYRTQRGVRFKRSIEIFESERRQHERKIERVDVRNLSTPSAVRRKRSPVPMFHLPRYRDLSTEEAELCSSNSIIPKVYFDIKDQLTTDCKKYNGILLKKARKMIKIDVNKTRKIFDLLMEQGFLWPPVTEAGKTCSSRTRRKRRP